MKFIAFLMLASASAAFGQGDIQVRQAWARATAPGAKVGAAYLEVRNAGGEADRLMSAATPAAKRVELHVTQRDGEVMRMRQVQSLEVPARGSLKLEPGGAHLMLVDLATPLKEGAVVPLTLRFSRAGEIAVDATVRAIGSTGAGQHRHSH